MDTNTLLGVLLLGTGVADLLVARSLAGRLPGASRIGLTMFGIVFVLVGLALALGWLRLV